MKKKLILGLIAIAASAAVYAQCTTHTTWYNGKAVTCNTCCYGGNCTTTCY